MGGFYREALALAGETAELRRHLHQCPESCFAEYKTAAFIRKRLKDLGVPFEQAGETGTVAFIRGEAAVSGPGPVAALRADIDGLEIDEQNDVPYRSRHEHLMHACGHDAHSASLLCAAKLLTAHRRDFPGTVKLIFQPAEESGAGAEPLMRTGLLDDVGAFFGIHNQPDLPVGKIGLHAGAVMAGANTLNIRLKGKGGHAGYPHSACDVIAAGAAIVEGLQHIVSREIPPTESCTVSVCQFHAGTLDNIIAGEARLSGTLRITGEDTRRKAAEAVKRICAGIGGAHRVEAETVCEYATPVMINSEELYGLALAAATEVLPDSPIDFIPQMGTEDFSRYARIASAFFAFVGSGGKHPLHHERFDIDEGMLPVAAALYANFAVKATGTPALFGG